MMPSAPALASALPRLATQWPALEHVELVDDEAIAPGGCRVTTAAGEVDAQIDTQLDRIVAAGMRIMYSPEMADERDQAVQSQEPVAKKLADNVTGLLLTLDQQAKL